MEGPLVSQIIIKCLLSPFFPLFATSLWLASPVHWSSSIQPKTHTPSSSSSSAPSTSAGISTEFLLQPYWFCLQSRYATARVIFFFFNLWNSFYIPTYFPKVKAKLLYISNTSFYDTAPACKSVLQHKPINAPQFSYSYNLVGAWTFHSAPWLWTSVHSVPPVWNPFLLTVCLLISLRSV